MLFIGLKIFLIFLIFLKLLIINLKNKKLIINNMIYFLDGLNFIIYE